MISQIEREIIRLAERYCPRVVLVHAGVNNLSKTYLYENEFQQLQSTKNELFHLEQSIQNIILQNKQVKVILSTILVTKDGFVNARAGIMNEIMKSCCERNK